MISLSRWMYFGVSLNTLFNSSNAVFCPQFNIRTMPVVDLSSLANNDLPTQYAPQEVCVPPSNVTGRLAIALNQCPKSHHEVMITFSGASSLILMSVSYQPSFMLGTELWAW